VPDGLPRACRASVTSGRNFVPTLGSWNEYVAICSLKVVGFQAVNLKVVVYKWAGCQKMRTQILDLDPDVHFSLTLMRELDMKNGHLIVSCKHNRGNKKFKTLVWTFVEDEFQFAANRGDLWQRVADFPVVDIQEDILAFGKGSWITVYDLEPVSLYVKPWERGGVGAATNIDLNKKKKSREIQVHTINVNPKERTLFCLSGTLPLNCFLLATTTATTKSEGWHIHMLDIDSGCIIKSFSILVQNLFILG
jgi:hypothetical protein